MHADLSEQYGVVVNARELQEKKCMRALRGFFLSFLSSIRERKEKMKNGAPNSPESNVWATYAPRRFWLPM